MKNWISWIVGGLLSVSMASYLTLRDPIDDLWRSSFAFEQLVSTSYEEELGDEEGAPERETVYVQRPGSRTYSSNHEGRRSFQRNQPLTLQAFRESVGDLYKSTVRIRDKGGQIALGAIVSTDGWIVTKASEMPDHIVDVRLHDGSRAEGIIKNRRNDLDLALIKIDRTNLQPVQWSPAASVSVGSWVVSTDFRNQPAAIGVLSVVNRSVPKEKPVLGVKLEEVSDNTRGALVGNVVEGSGADRAGVKMGDIILSINGMLLKSKDEVIKKLESMTAGQRVEVTLLRDEKKETTIAQMMDLSHALQDPTEMEVNGEISARATGFHRVFQHDSVIYPYQCGGPILDVYGNVIGLNIARAGRVASYAIPATVVAPAVEAMLAEVNTNVKMASSNEPSAAVSKNSPLPASVPKGIVVETLKPEVSNPSGLPR